jgi:chemotaxis protein MotB
MAKEKSIIVIKKITVAGGGGHGGSWKVALADFMTALMAFFLVMWLLGQSDQTKKAVSDYFSTPSIIEYNFQNFGVELTLEKLFLDLLNEPLKAFQSFMEPSDKTPNVLDMGSAKVVTAFIADKMTDLARNVNITQDGFEFDIPDNVLFERGSGRPTQDFITMMDRIQALTTGLEDANVSVTSMMFIQTVPDMNPDTANKVASERSDLITKRIQSTLEHTTVSIAGNINVKDKKGEADPSKLIGLIRISVKQKEQRADGKRPRKLENLFGESKADMSVYDNFVHQITNKKKKEAATEAAEVKERKEEFQKTDSPAPEESPGKWETPEKSN